MGRKKNPLLSGNIYLIKYMKKNNKEGRQKKRELPTVMLTRNPHLSSSEQVVSEHQFYISFLVPFLSARF